jgi:uncharacterized protein (DUF1786 family)
MKATMSFNKINSCLLFDIGAGTRDIMLINDFERLENCPKLVAPTVTRMLARQIKSLKRNLKISGGAIGGGALSQALLEHLKSGYQIEIEKEAAFTIRNNFSQLEEMGFTVKEKIENPDLYFDEIQIQKIIEMFSSLGVNCDSISFTGISVQDHGDHDKNESSRKNRFKIFISLLEDEPDLRRLVFKPGTLPDCFTRMKSAVKSIKTYLTEPEIVIMDTCISAIAGCYYDNEVKKCKGPVMYINFGNGHTLVCIMEGFKILSLYEHHTGIIKNNLQKFKANLIRLAEGRLDFEEVYNDMGHGCKTFIPVSYDKIEKIVITGPNRTLAPRTGLKDYYLASPGGDMMMTGPLGLLRGYNLIQEKMQ